MNSREEAVRQGYLRYQLDRQAFRCPFCGAALNLQSVMLLDTGTAVVAGCAYASHYIAAQVHRANWEASQPGGTVPFSR